FRSQHLADAGHVRPGDAIACVLVRRSVRVAAAADLSVRSAGDCWRVRLRERLDQCLERARAVGLEGRIMTATTTPVRVLVVDDSAYIRKVVKEMLSRSPGLEVVGTARDSE